MVKGQIPTQLLTYPSFLSRTSKETGGESSWAEIDRVTSLITYSHGQNGLNLGTVNLLPVRLDLCSEKQKQILSHHLSFPLSQAQLHSSPTPSSRGGMGRGWSVLTAPCGCSHFAPAPAWTIPRLQSCKRFAPAQVLHEQQFLQELSICPSMGSPTGCPEISSLRWSTIFSLPSPWCSFCCSSLFSLFLCLSRMFCPFLSGFIFHGALPASLMDAAVSCGGIIVEPAISQRKAASPHRGFPAAPTESQNGWC